MQQQSVPSFIEAVEAGDVTHKSGYHQPRSGRGSQRCGCALTTDKGAYRDVTVDLPDGRTVHFYHQSPVVVEDGDEMRISSCGYHTRTTKDRIRGYLPSGYNIIQRDFDWYLTTPDGERVDFEDGMTVDV